MKCGRPIECASARACATADAEQQLRSPSFSGSDHSSSVTATASPVAGAQQRGDGAVDAPAHRHERPAAPARAGSAAALADRRAERARERVRRQLRGVELAGLSPPSSAAISRGADPRRVEHRAPRTSVTAALPAAVAAPQPCGLEAGVVDAIARRRDRERDPVAARDRRRRCTRAARPAGR